MVNVPIVTCYSSLAPVYDRWLGTEAYHRMINFLQWQSQDDLEGATIVDLCCGTGTLALLLAERQARVVGIDASAEMLAVARSRTTTSPHLQPEFVLANLESDELNLRNVDLVLCTFDSLNYFSPYTLAALIHRAYTYLAPGGCFIGDINTPFKLKSIFGNTTYSENHDDYSYIWKNKLGDGWIDFEIHLRRSAKDNDPAIETLEHHRQFIHEPSDLAGYLSWAGFRSPEYFDSYESVNVGPETLRLTFVAEKPL